MGLSLLRLVSQLFVGPTVDQQKDVGRTLEYFSCLHLLNVTSCTLAQEGMKDRVRLPAKPADMS